MSLKEVTINHNYSDQPLKLMRKYILAIDFILQNDLEQNYLDFLTNLSDDYSEFFHEIEETLKEFSISDEAIKEAADKLIKIPVVS